MVCKKPTENMQPSSSLSAPEWHLKAISHLCWTCQ